MLKVWRKYGEENFGFQLTTLSLNIVLIIYMYNFKYYIKYVSQSDGTVYIADFLSLFATIYYKFNTFHNLLSK